MCRGKAEVWDEPEESRCREAAVLAEDDWGCGAERDVDSGILPAAPREGKPVLLVATQTESRPSGTEKVECSGQSCQFRACQCRRYGNDGRIGAGATRR